jgi:hypothetical protein
VRVYLPEGEWRRFPGGEPFAGGRTHELVLALDELAAFARRGAEIRLGPAVRTRASWARRRASPRSGALPERAAALRPRNGSSMSYIRVVRHRMIVLT